MFGKDEIILRNAVFFTLDPDRLHGNKKENKRPNKQDAYSTAAYNFLHALCPMHVQPALGESHSETGLP
jgi:hypothetical protein